MATIDVKDAAGATVAIEKPLAPGRAAATASKSVARCTEDAAQHTGPTVGTITSVGDAATSTTILASNAARKGASFFNESSAILYLATAAGTVSATAYTVQVPGSNGYFELPIDQGGVYTGIVMGIWASDAGGSVRVTERT